MKKVKYLSLIMIMVLMLTGCGSTDSAKNNEKNDNKPIAVNPPSKPGYTGVKKIVYLDPTDLNKKCTENNSDSDDETKGGCMKWYAYKEDNDTYTMILDHNTTDLVNWVTKADYISAGGKEEDFGEWEQGNTDKGPITAKKQLESDTSSWNNSLNPRLIKASEIREITGNKGTEYYNFETNTDKEANPKPSVGKYAWLYDRTAVNCVADFGGLNNATKKGHSYWTDTPDGEKFAWIVDYNDYGRLASSPLGKEWWNGIRPVITVQKSNLSFVETNEE